MPAFECHLFAAATNATRTTPRLLRSRGSRSAPGQIQDRTQEAETGSPLSSEHAGCLDQCESGPVVVLYPQAIWYGGVTPDDVERILDETVIGGRVIEELRIPDERLNSKK